MTSFNQYELYLSITPQSTTNYPIQNSLNITNKASWILGSEVKINAANLNDPVSLLSFSLTAEELIFSYPYSSITAEIPFEINICVQVPKDQKQILQLNTNINPNNLISYQVANSGTPPLSGMINSNPQLNIPLTQ